MTPKILLFDIETAPGRAFVWGDRKYEVDVIEFISLPYILSYAYKWLGEKKIHVRALPDFAGYEKNRECDKELVASLLTLQDEASIVVAHNGDKFDLRFTNTRALIYSLLPPEPYRSIDTLKTFRKHTKFPSNKLDDLGLFLFGPGGRKLPHTGFNLWSRCIGGPAGTWPFDPKAWALMRRYNARDVDLLEKIYLKIRPWTTTHPRLSLYTRNFDACPVCQSKQIVNKGRNYLTSGWKQRFKCNSCGHRFVAGKVNK